MEGGEAWRVLLGFPLGKGEAGMAYRVLGYDRLSLKPGYRHTLTVTLDKNPEKVKIDIGGEIGDWN